jgi:hypothetical protein
MSHKKEYLCTMKNDIIIPDHFPLLKEEDVKAADKRREDYSRARDLQANKDNEAIAKRLARELQKPV